MPPPGPITGTITPPTKTASILIASAAIDLNSNAPVVVYDGEADPSLIVDTMILRSFSGPIATAELTISFTGLTLVIPLGAIGPDAPYQMNLSRFDNYVSGQDFLPVLLPIETDVIATRTTVLEGSAATCRIDLFGYFVDVATDLPIPNVR